MHKEISKIHYLTQDLQDRSHQDLARMACEGRMDWVQLRVKAQDYDDWLDTAWDVKKICNEFNARLIINDSIEIAREIGADGVHLGKNDFSPIMARAILGPGKIIGGTANTIDDIRELNEAGVDYIGLGPFRYTETKNNLSPVLGIEGYRQIMSICKKENLDTPIIAIGGITPDDLEALLNTGLHGVAVSSAINKSTNPGLAAINFHEGLTNIAKANQPAKTHK